MIREFQPKQTGHCTGGRTMEQRWSLRKPVTFEVKVVYKCHPVILGQSRNIGLEGLFIETGIMILPVGSCIEVEFGLMAGTQWEEVHMPAVVVHRNRDGCGIAFQTFNGKAFRVIEQLLYTHVVAGVKPWLFAAAMKWRNGTVVSLRNVLLRFLDAKTGYRHQSQFRTG
jgi:hypothetical protein